MKLLESKKIKAKDVKVGDTIKVVFDVDWRQHLKGEDGLLTVDEIDHDNGYIYFIQFSDGNTFSVKPNEIIKIV